LSDHDGPFGQFRPFALLILALSLLSLPAMGGGDGAGWAGAKIRFDLSLLDDSGLYGPPDGLRALHYEFCIPDRPGIVLQVHRIDGSVRVQRAPGRSGCSESELLCIGTTHQPGYREVLARLARLPYVTRIEQAFFE
jgi:hypothetical protein